MSVQERRAALELHRLGPADRGWVLGRLTAAEQARLRPLLAELDAMGVRFDDLPDELSDGLPDELPDTRAEDLPGGSASPASPRASPQAWPRAALRAALRAADPTAVAAVLATEPAWLVRHIFAADTWPWQETVRRAMARGHALAPEIAGTSIGGPGLAPAATEALLRLVAERVLPPPGAGPAAGTNAVRPTNGNGGGVAWQRLWTRARQWLG